MSAAQEVAARTCCPHCRVADWEVQPDSLACRRCRTAFPVRGRTASLIDPAAAAGVKQDIQSFWSGLHKHQYDEREIGRDELLSLLDDLEALFESLDHLAVREMPVRELRGRDVLEVGCGTGAHSTLFASKYGARMTSLDITPDRIVSTAKKMETAGVADYIVVQGDGENLPFPDDSFDIVYSNGVLHHTPDTPGSIREVLRVLRPGGRAVIMLYARYSFYYLVGLLLWRGLLRGEMLRSRQWLGNATEMFAKPGQTANPETKVYSEAEIRELFRGYGDVRVRKSGFHIIQLPGLGKHLQPRIRAWQPMHPSGTIIYGDPYPEQTTIERWLGPLMGWAMNISARKPG